MMRKFWAILLLLAVMLPLIGCNQDSSEAASITTEASVEEEVPVVTLPLNIMTFNLRYDTTSHPLMALSQRGPRLISLIEQYDPDSIGFCEATDDWMNFLRGEMEALGYSYVGVGRDAGEDSPTLTGIGNEHNPVFYKTEKFELINDGTIWLSNTPGTAGSRSWDSSCNRICTWAILKDKETGLVYAHMATHLDHVSEEAQHNGVRVIQAQMEQLKVEYGDIGVVLSGDFNAVAFDSTNPSYRPITYQFTTSFMDDSHTLASEIGVEGSTFCGYQNPDDWERGHASDKDKPAVDTETSPIDYIFLTKGGFAVSYYTVVNDTFTFEYKGRTYHNHPVSDHYGVFAKVTFIPGKAQAPDEKDAIDYPAVLTAGELPKGLSTMTELIAGSKLTSGLLCGSSVNNLKKEDSYAELSPRLEGGHYYWEITAKLEKLAEISGISMLNDSSNPASGAECFVSKDGTNWEKVGESIFGQMGAGERYTWSLAESVQASYVKFVLFDCPNKARLASVSVWGEEIETGELTLSAVSGPKAGQKEGYEMLLDGDLTTKFYINTSNDALSPLIFRSESPATALKYSFVTANDHDEYTDRLPLGWTLSGSADGESWTVLDEVAAPGMESKNYESYTYEIAAPGEYTFYKLEFKLASSGKMQFSEFALLRK